MMIQCEEDGGGWNVRWEIGVIRRWSLARYCCRERRGWKIFWGVEFERGESEGFRFLEGHLLVDDDGIERF